MAVLRLAPITIDPTVFDGDTERDARRSSLEILPFAVLMILL
jgi:hypothetical protein